MKWFKNQKISVKFTSAFFVILFIAATVGVVIIIMMSNMQTQSKKLFINKGNSQGDLGYVAAEFQKQRSLYRDMIIEKDDVKTKTYNENLNKSWDSMMKYFQDYGTKCETETEKASYKELQDMFVVYEGVVRKIVDPCLVGDYDKAYRELREQSAIDAVTVLLNALEKAVDINVEDANKMLLEQEANINNSIILVLSAVVIVMVFAVFFGIFVSRIISKPIKQLSEAANSLAGGDTGIKLFDFDQKDEVGLMYNSFKAILTNIRALIEDVNALSESAIQGKLSVRADATKHQGDYKKIVEGINETLNAIVEPIYESTAVLGEMAKGNLNTCVTGDYKGDYAVLKNALNETIDALKSYIGEISKVLGEMSEGELDVTITSDFKGDFIELKKSINTIIESLNAILSDINIAAEQVAGGTRQVSDGSQSISQGATEQASSIEELTASITQIAAQTKQNAANADKANELGNMAKTDAAAGNGQMKNMQRAMADINAAAVDIGKIIKVIDDIAFQTNILALNAAVEAARAGIHGKGFAVVAEEVRNLAARSAAAAKETTALIEGSIEKTEAGTKIADETAAALEGIVAGVDKAVQLVGEIAVASNEQATAIAQVNKGIEQMSQVVQTNSATAEEAAAASEELSGQAELLKNMVGRFRLKSGKAKEKPQASKPAAAAVEKKDSNKPKIILNDMEFGKY